MKNMQGIELGKDQRKIATHDAPPGRPCCCWRRKEARAGAVSLATEEGQIMKRKDEYREETLALHGALFVGGRRREVGEEERRFRDICQLHKKYMSVYQSMKESHVFLTVELRNYFLEVIRS